jgi:hypothetical protein
MEPFKSLRIAVSLRMYLNTPLIPSSPFDLYKTSGFTQGATVQANLINYASLTVAGTNATLYNSRHIGDNASIVLLSSEMLLRTVSMSLESNASFSGTGSMTGTVYNSGRIIIGNITTGNTPAPLSITNLNQSAVGVLYMGILSLFIINYY